MIFFGFHKNLSLRTGKMLLNIAALCFGGMISGFFFLDFDKHFISLNPPIWSVTDLFV